jgi:hypothetical protein
MLNSAEIYNYYNNMACIQMGFKWEMV